MGNMGYGTHARPVAHRQAALDYAARGWPVMPCAHREADPVTLVRGARVPARDPSPPSGTTPVTLVRGARVRAGSLPVPGRRPAVTMAVPRLADATTDPARIREWWDGVTAYNIAIATGAPGPDVLEFELGTFERSRQAYQALKDAGHLAGTFFTATTPSGGLHVYFPGTAQSCRRSRWSHVRLWSSGGYVLAPPSVVDGKLYAEIGSLDVAGAPFFWHEAEHLLNPFGASPVQISGRYDHADVEQLVRWLSKQDRGSQLDELFAVACRATDDGCSDEGFVRLAEAATGLGLPAAEVRRTIRSARRLAG